MPIFNWIYEQKESLRNVNIISNKKVIVKLGLMTCCKASSVLHLWWGSFFLFGKRSTFLKELNVLPDVFFAFAIFTVGCHSNKPERERNNNQYEKHSNISPFENMSTMYPLLVILNDW